MNNERCKHVLIGNALPALDLFSTKDKSLNVSRITLIESPNLPATAKSNFDIADFSKTFVSKVKTTNSMNPRKAASPSMTNSTPVAPPPPPNRNNLFPSRVLVNAHCHRIDVPLPGLTAKATDYLNNIRVGRQRSCNDHHLLRFCSRGDDCSYSHEPLEAEILPALAWGPRRMPCKMNGDCRSETCLFGHCCTASWCTGPGKNCRFSMAQHELDMSDVREWDGVSR